MSRYQSRFKDDVKNLSISAMTKDFIKRLIIKRLYVYYDSLQANMKKLYQTDKNAA